MSLTFRLVGGPPWGFRVSHDAELRPVVGQIIPGSRAFLSGIHIGDVIMTVDGLPVASCNDAHAKIHANRDEMTKRLPLLLSFSHIPSHCPKFRAFFAWSKFDKNSPMGASFGCFGARVPENYHPTVRREKLSSSVHNSPVFQRNSSPPSSVPSSPVLPRTNPHLSRSSPRQVRLDMMHGSKAATEGRRRFFEQCAARSEPVLPVTERLLKKKIQMGVQKGPPTESSGGYDSAAGDFAGRSSSTSLRTSPEGSSAGAEDVDEKTLIVDEVPVQKPDPGMYVSSSYDPSGAGSYYSQRLQNQAAGPSEWRVQTQINNAMPAQGDVEVPGRKTVAALRQMINDRLEMKTPTGGVSAMRPKTPSDELSTPSWAHSVRVHEPSDFIDPHANKHNMGRVLDGPVNPQKFFQGVPPPSYNLVQHQPPQHPPIEAKPPAPPKPTQQRTSSTIRIAPQPAQELPPTSNSNLLNLNPPAKPMFRSPYHTSERQSDVNSTLNSSMDSRGFGGEDLDDGASMISSCISTFGDSSEVAAFSACGAARSLYDQYRQQQLNQNAPKREVETPMAKPEPIPEPKSLLPPSSLFSSDIQLTPFGQSNVEKKTEPPVAEPTVRMSEPRESTSFADYSQSGSRTSLPRSSSRHSLDLESSELLLKSKSPAPYSSSSADHYGTIRRRHTPVRLSEVASSSETVNSPAAHVEHRSNDSGYEGSSARSPDTARYEKDPLLEPFDLASSIASSLAAASDSRTELSIDSRRPDSFMSTSTYDATDPLLTPNSPPATSMSSREPKQTPRPPVVAAGVLATPAPLGEQPTSHAAHSHQNPTATSTTVAEEDDDVAPKRHFHPATEPEMSLWYRNMFKKMHKVPQDEVPAESILRQTQREEHSPTPTNNSSRPLTPSTHVTRAQRFEVDITPRRARSVGRVVEPDDQPGGSNLYAWQRSQTPHFHLPSYKFRDEDPRPIRCSFGGCGTPCARCRRPRRDQSFEEVDRIYDQMDRQNEKDAEKTQRRLALRCMTEKLDATTEELEQFIDQLDKTWRRSRKKERSPARLAEEIAELKRLSKEEVLLKQKADRLTNELQKEKDRRHAFVPSIAPALQNNMDRFDTLMKDYSYRQSPIRDDVSVTTNSQRAPVLTATAIYRFDAKSARELSLNKGDVVRLTREIDSHWMEGERNGKCGIFPASYVQVEYEFERSRQKMRAVYPFTARNSNELSLKMGEIVTFRREIDLNWMEGSNHIGQIGIFPSSYVRMLSDPPQEAPSAIVPDRPKTPKLPTNPVFDPDVPPIHIEPQQSRPMVRFEEDKPTMSNGYVQQEFQPLKNEIQALDRLALWEGRKTTRPEDHDFFDRRPFEHNQPSFGVPSNAAAPRASAPVTSRPPGDIRANPASVIPRGSEMYRAVFPYKPEKSDELELHVNDIVFVVEKCDDGWYIGTSLRTGIFGTFPGNYVQRH
ncbi:unnamed protein product [Caenorhabditis auriculariae]|uniref:Uncharacterized protein n=1 Tax=Caenorhabditis auriculariae TaxID=2777116 RepID=A0A8S1HJA3_9PELO|nr:unnamed protein product [Caenorhabditis auriculariae]